MANNPVKARPMHLLWWARRRPPSGAVVSAGGPAGPNVSTSCGRLAAAPSLLTKITSSKPSADAWRRAAMFVS